jgi:hypothetical protein
MSVKGMSGKSTVAVTAGSHAAGSHAAAKVSQRSVSDTSARWAALDSRHERLVTASDAVLADIDRKDDRRMAS